MDRLNAWDTGNVIVDINQGFKPGAIGAETLEEARAVFREEDRPLISRVEFNIGDMPKGTLLYGYMYVNGAWGEHRQGGKTVYGRYHKAKLPDGREFPVCFVLGFEDGAPRVAGAPPGVLWIWRSLPITPVRRYIFE